MHHFSDIHTHDLTAGSDAVINLPWGYEIPATGNFSVGLHPWDTDKEVDWHWLENAAKHPNVVAIGEAGLDALRGAPLSEQEKAFVKQVELSEAVGKPLIIHAVRTIQRIIELHKQLHPKQLWIIHGFRGKPQLAQALVREGIAISLGSRFNPAVPAVVPPALLFYETDKAAQ